MPPNPPCTAPRGTGETTSRPAVLWLGIDPGPTESAFCYYDGRARIEAGKCENVLLLDCLRGGKEEMRGADALVIEQVASYGMPVGAEVFGTCVWTGRFLEAWGGPYVLLPRLAVKLHLCHDSRAKDSNIRQALLDRFGPQGTKAAPGATYGLKADLWAALAVAATAADTAAELRIRAAESDNGLLWPPRKHLDGRWFEVWEVTR